MLERTFPKLSTSTIIMQSHFEDACTESICWRPEVVNYVISRVDLKGLVEKFREFIIDSFLRSSLSFRHTDGQTKNLLATIVEML